MTRVYDKDPLDDWLGDLRLACETLGKQNAVKVLDLVVSRLPQFERDDGRRRVSRERTQEEFELLLRPVWQRVRHEAPQTGVDAATLTTQETAERAWEVLLRIYGERGPHTDDEAFILQRDYGPPLTQNTLRPRRSDLVRYGFVRDSGLRRNSAAGRPATVWELVPDHLRRLEKNE